MSELILHQYDVSPFSEKIRKIFALKRLSWSAVEQPVIAPKPELVPLTGGYRRVPVLQTGADVWCDTAIITHRLEALRPEPTCFPAGLRGACEMIAHWADHWLFLAAVPPTIARVLPSLPEGFVEDRRKMSPGFTEEALRSAVPESRNRLLVGIDWLDDQVRSSSFVLGETFSLADASCFHVLWFLRGDPESFGLVEERRSLREWFARVSLMGEGDRHELSARDALALARETQPATESGSDGSDPAGIEPGDPVTVAADDYGGDPVSGTALVVTRFEIALRREDPDLGEVVVHFPRAGFRIRKGHSGPRDP